MSAEANLRKKNIALPDAPQPVANYVTSLVLDSYLYVSGHGPAPLAGVRLTGKLGADLTVEEGYRAARQTGLGILATVRARLGSLDRVERVVKILGMVNATPEFRDHPKVINGCSDLFVEVFGEDRGRGTRSAVGMGSLPGGIATEIEAIFRLVPENTSA
jgi:enamine deaminase RidA (YjgF/YER057c/UK114 family)